MWNAFLPSSLKNKCPSIGMVFLYLLAVALERPARAQQLAEQAGQVGRGNAHLRHAVAVAHGDRTVLHGVEVDGHAERGARLVVAAVPLPDRARVVVLDEEARAFQILRDLRGAAG